MSQVARIMGARVTGMVYLGAPGVPGDPDAPPVDTWSGDPERVVEWLWDGYRGRFNDRRALRRKYAYQPNPHFDETRKPGKDNPRNIPVLDGSGERVLVPIGREPGVDRLKSAFKREFSWAAGIPDLMLQHADRAENKDWFAATKRRQTLHGKGRAGGGMPLFRSAKREHTRFAIMTGGPKCKSPQARFTRTGRKSGLVTITGCNPKGKNKPGHGARWSVQFRVRYSQPIRAYTSVTVDWTARRLVFVSPVPARAHEFTGAVAGIDVGVKHTIVTSDEGFFDQPTTADLDARIKRHQRSMARKRRINNPSNQRGWTPTTAYQDERDALARVHADKKARLDDWRHKTTTTLVSTYDVIAYESLNVRGMTRSAKGTTGQPGKNVKAKSGLNRSLANSAFATLRAMIEYKATTAGVLAVPVPPKNTSRQCNQCGHTAKENRESQAVFRCVDCGHTTNADINAANNILALGLTRLPVAANAGGPGHAPAGDIIDRTDPTLVVEPSGEPGTVSLQTLPEAA